MEKERFFGLHFDFHAGNDTEIGLRTDPEDIERYILDAQPDFIQCDCKGHPGNSSYPTKVGKAADKLRADNLRIWCDVAKKHGLPIFMHYSGVWDMEYCKAHPEDARVDEQGERDGRVSLFSDYVHKLLIPQLKELIDDYGIAGVWVDGDCWAVQRDYSDLAKPYLYEGITKEEHNKLMHDAFLKYVKTYTDELHAHAPQFKVISNWLYSSYTPEKCEIDVDFISGDYPPNDSVHAARYEGRCMAAQNKKWDLMAWSFAHPHYTEKPAVQLMQEAATVLSLGGGFQMYITQNADGSARRNNSARIRETGEFVRARRMLYGKKTLAQTAIFHSAESFYKKSEIFNAAGATQPLIGALNAVLDAQYTANVLLEYQIDRLGEYDIVVIPEWEEISEENKQKLLAYAENGGRLVVIGTACCRQFGALTGTEFGEVKTYAQACLLDDDGNFAGLTRYGVYNDTAEVLDLKTGEGAIYRTYDLRDSEMPAFRIDAWGKGKIAYIPFNFGSLYFDTRTYITENYVRKILGMLAAPRVQINRRGVDITLQQGENECIVNLINMQQGRHSLNYVVYNEIPPVYQVELTLDKAYAGVKMPLGETFTYEIGENTTRIFIEKLDIHSIILLEE